jgi:hypothetical protein
MDAPSRSARIGWWLSALLAAYARAAEIAA